MSAQRRRRVLYQRRAQPYVQTPTPIKGRRPVLYQRRAQPYVWPPMCIQGPEARPIPTSIPKVTLLALNPIPFQKRPHLILKILLRMVRRLRIDVPNQRIQIRRPDRKRTIPPLPRKLRQPGRLALEPLGRRRLQLGNQPRDIGLTIQPDRQMNMVGNPTDAKTLALIVANNGREIGIEVGTNSVVQRRRAILRAEDDVHEEKAQRSRHSAECRSARRPTK